MRQSKARRLRKLSQKVAPADNFTVEWSCYGVTPEPVYEPGDVVIHWTPDDKFIREIIGADGQSHYHEHASERK